jgi:hypothetical protein
MAALTKNDATPRPTPNCALNASLCRSRSAMTADMSTSLKVVSIAATCCASTRRLAIVARRFDMRDRSSSRSPSGRGAGAGGGAAGALADTGIAVGAGNGAATGAAMLAGGAAGAGVDDLSTSARVTRGPSLLIDPSSICASRAALRAEGVAATPRSLVLAPGGVFVSGVADPAAAGAGEAAAPPSAIVPSTSPIFTSAPAACAMCSSTPFCGAGTSTSTLSVSSSTSGSPTRTASPSAFNHLAIRASTIDSPISGTTMFTAMTVCRSSLAGGPAESQARAGARPYCANPSRAPAACAIGLDSPRCSNARVMSRS